jgi:hypothetical protein
MSQQLEVVADIPTGAIRVISSETISKIEAAQKSAASIIAITSSEQASAAELALRDTAVLSKAVESARVAAKAPFLAAERKIDEAAKAPLATLKAVETTLRGKLSTWALEEDRRRREEEKRRAEKARLLEQERLRLEAEKRRLDEERKRAAAAPVAIATPTIAIMDDLGDAFEVQAIEQVDAEKARIAVAAAAIQPAKAEIPKPNQGVSYRKVLKHVVTDAQLLPTHCVTVTANDNAIRACYCAAWDDTKPVPQVPGIVFTVEMVPFVQTARRGK